MDQVEFCSASRPGGTTRDGYAAEDSRATTPDRAKYAAEDSHAVAALYERRVLQNSIGPPSPGQTRRFQNQNPGV